MSLANLRNFDQVSSYSLNLSVSDGIYSAFTQLKIGLVSANSFAPVFEKTSYKVQFAEGQPEGVRVAGKRLYCFYIVDFKAISEVYDVQQRACLHYQKSHPSLH